MAESDNDEATTQPQAMPGRIPPDHPAMERVAARFRRGLARAIAAGDWPPKDD
jgi:hypothetical protein